MDKKLKKEGKKAIERIKSHYHFDKDEVMSLWLLFSEHTGGAGGVGTPRLASKEQFARIIKDAIELHPSPDADGLEGLDPALVADIVFAEFDRDLSGFIDFEEFVQGMSVRTRGTAEELVEFVFNTFDTAPRDGRLSKEEFFAKMQKSVDVGKRLLEAQFKLAEAELVRDADAATVEASRAEIQAVHAELTSRAVERKLEEIRSYIDEVFKEADRNRDGVITLEEFKDYVRRTKDHRLLLIQTHGSTLKMDDAELEAAVSSALSRSPPRASSFRATPGAAPAGAAPASMPHSSPVLPTLYSSPPHPAGSGAAPTAAAAAAAAAGK